MIHPKDLSIQSFTYQLPAEKIAEFPSPERDSSRLLIWDENFIKEDIFKNVANYLPESSIIIFNNSSVIPARVLFKKPSGSTIEIFCLEPYDPSDYNLAICSRNNCRWVCMVGGLSKWKEAFLEKKIIIEGREVTLRAILIKTIPQGSIIEFSWDDQELSFGEILDQTGEIPLPPYIKRKIQISDHERYQTIFAERKGSVAAPTAALHFTKEVRNSLLNKEIEIDFVTLHVGAGTFKPVKSSIMEAHSMHAEWFEVTVDSINKLIPNIHKTITAVGTTATRTLESVYWMGVKAYLNPDTDLRSLTISQWEVYEAELKDMNLTRHQSLTALSNWLKCRDMQSLVCQTSILIAPTYRFRMVNKLITNFHQPQSTLLLLVAAAVGEQWKNIYNYALQHNFRFLSYGDACLLNIADSN